MTAYYIHPTLGSDARTSAQAQSSSTPWKTLLFAYRNAAVVDGDKIWLGTPSAGTITWSGNDARLDTRGIPNGTNQSKRITFEVPAGTTAKFEVPHGQGVRDSNGSFVWIIINPNQVQILKGSSDGLIFHDLIGTGWPADASIENSGAAEFTSAIALINRSGAAGTHSAHNSLIDGITVDHWMGNGVYFEAVEGCHLRNADISHCATGIRMNAGNGTRVSTTLNGAVAKGATTATLNTTSGMSVGDMLVIGTGPTAQPRIISNIAGNVVTLGGYEYPNGPTMSTFPLEFAFASGTAAVTQFGAESCTIHHCDENTRGLGNPANGDVGGEALVFAKGQQRSAYWNCHAYLNYDIRKGSVDYNIDGTGLDPYAMKANSWNVLAWSNFHDNHAWIESGTDSSNLSAGNTNGGFIVYRNYIWGEIDQQNESPINPNANPTAGLVLCRATPFWVFRHNSCYITNGPGVGQGGTNRGGLRFRSGGQFGGTFEGMTITDNLLVYAVDSRLYDYTTIGSYPASHTNDYNMLYLVNGKTDGAAVSPSSVTYAMSASGLTSWRSATGFGAHDIWNVNPGMLDPVNGDLRVGAGSAAAFAASDGGAIGAAVLTPDVAVSAGVAAGSGGVQTALGKVSASISVGATGVGTASGAGVSGTTTGAAAGAATGTGSALQPKFSIAPSMPAAAGTGGVYLTIANDIFNRVGADLGVSSSGFSYAVANAGASGGGFATDGSVATLTLAAPTQQNDVELLNTSARDVRAVMRFKTDKPPVSDLIECWLWVRRAGMVVDAYGGHFLIFPTDVRGNFNRRDSAGVRTSIPAGGAITVPGVPAWAADTYWVMIFECFGASPTTLRMKVYREADGEPTDWQFSTTDSSGPQVAGAVGFAFRMDTGTTNAPIVYTFDDVAFTETVINTPSPEAAVGTPATAAVGTGAANNATTTGVPNIPSTNPHLTITMGPP